MMPTYVYRTKECDCPDKVVQHPMSEDPVICCDVHGHTMRRVPQATGVVLKGGGFYRSDSRNLGNPDKGVAPATPPELS